MLHIQEDLTTFGLFCGIGAGLKGMNRSKAQVINNHATYRAAFRCLGGIDVDPGCIKNFKRQVGVEGTVRDLFSHDQYCAWHGHPPPKGWREAGPSDVRKASGNRCPNIIFLSSPCKGFSGLLNTDRARSAKYQALNGLTLRGVWLALEAFKDDPAEFYVFENVPLIATRGKEFLAQIRSLLEHYGYAVAFTTHCCGELAGLAQRRKRFLLVARHVGKVQPFLYEPPKRSLRTIGDILEKLPLPGSDLVGPMHEMPNLSWKTWVRLALIEPGKDWRSLKRLAVEGGYLSELGIIPSQDYQSDVLGVRKFGQSSGCVPGRSGPTNGAYSVADPRPIGAKEYSQYGVKRFDEVSSTVTSQRSPGQGPFSVADPRQNIRYGNNSFQVSSLEVAGEPLDGLPDPMTKVHCVIRSEWNTWNRPFTTYELAAFQDLFDPEEGVAFELVGKSHTAWREWIGNAVPPGAGEAIGTAMGQAILLARSGQKFALGSTPIWVRPLVTAISVDVPTLSGHGISI